MWRGERTVHWHGHDPLDRPDVPLPFRLVKDRTPPHLRIATDWMMTVSERD